MELKPFDRMDWDAWAGAEGKNPLIGYTNDAAVIVDDNGIFVEFDDGSSWNFITHTSKAVAKYINFDIITPEGLAVLGFERIN